MCRTLFITLGWTLFLSPALTASDFSSDWEGSPDRVWIGPDTWANRLHDWRLADGRVECVSEAPWLGYRTLHLLSRELQPSEGGFSMSVRTGLLTQDVGAPRGGVGFLVGVGGGRRDHRGRALVQGKPGRGAGFFVGLRRPAQLVIVDLEETDDVAAEQVVELPDLSDLTLFLSVRPVAEGLELELAAVPAGEELARSAVYRTIPRERVLGGVALVSDPGTGKEGVHSVAPRFWFRDWRLSGERVAPLVDGELGPILSSQYTISRGVLKLTAQLFPLAEGECKEVRLENLGEDGWQTRASTEVERPSFTAHLRIEDWAADRDVSYRVACEYRRGERTETDYWRGTFRRDPVEKPAVVVAGFTGNHMVSHQISKPRFDWVDGVWFPHSQMLRHVRHHHPDLLFFSGDQVYEGRSPTYADRKHIHLDYLYKWFLWCWAYRDVTRDVPCVTIPDDHDVYQGNLWGEAGRKAKRDHFGGYVHPAGFVRMVERTQTSHLPDPVDPTPVEQGIGVWFTHLVWGRVSFALIEDRKFKSGCAGRLPPTGTKRPDHINNADFDVLRADIPGVQLLGERQLRFLEAWAADWRGADLKMALSQTVFAGLATHHGGALEFLIADLDSNGWPQTGRRKAVQVLRKAHAFHLAGDQHLASLAQHGIDAHDDAIWSFAVPSVANFYPRKWQPKAPGKNRADGAPEWSGQHFDGFRNRVTVHAVTNPGQDMGHEPRELHDGMPGYGIVRVEKAARSYRAECWPLFADPRDGDGGQYPGWPRVIEQESNDGREPVAWLPRLEVRGLEDAVVEVRQASGELVYALRTKGTSFDAKVYTPGEYRVRIGDADRELWQELNSVRARSRKGEETIVLDFTESARSAPSTGDKSS